MKPASFRYHAPKTIEQALAMLAKYAAEAQLAGRAPEPAVFRAAAEATSTAIDPLTNMQTDAVYRRQLVGVVTRRALERAMG